MGLIGRLIRMARKHWFKLGIASVGLVCSAALTLVTPEIVRRFLFLLETNTLSEDLLIGMVLLLIAAYSLRAVFRFIAMSISHLAAWRFVADLTFDLYDRIQLLSLKYFQDKQTGQLLSRLINDPRQIEILVAHALPDLVSSLLVVIGVVIMLFRINALLAALALTPVPFIVLISTLFSSKVAPLFRINQEVLGDISGTLQDNLSGIKEIQAFGQEETEHNRLDWYRRRYASVNIRANFANGIFHPGIELMTSLGSVIIIGIGGYMALQGKIPVSDLIGLLMYLGLFYQPLTVLARLVEDVQTAIAGAVRVFDVVDTKSDITEKEDAVTLKRGKGKIRFDHVCFAYEPKEPVLDDVSFIINPGEMIAFVGPTGVGKTTIISLLERFYDPQSGRILIDDTDIRDVTIHSLRKQISLVLQDVFLFNGTVAQNIAYGAPGATREEIMNAAQMACADGFINDMPNGYDTVVGERGFRLSGGQKQRLAIARAILRDAPILILDEATSAVDAKTEAEIQKSISYMAGKRTLLVIAHRLSTVMRADKILVFSEGRVVECGTHEELLTKKGLYFELVKTQTKNNDIETESQFDC